MCAFVGNVMDLFVRVRKVVFIGICMFINFL